MSSIESMELDSDVKWRSLPLDPKINKSFHLLAVSFSSRVFVFGGVRNISFNMYSFNEEGDLEEDLSEDPMIPGYVGYSPFVIQGRRVFTIGMRKFNGVWKRRLEAFDE